MKVVKVVGSKPASLAASLAIDAPGRSESSDKDSALFFPFLSCHFLPSRNYNNFTISRVNLLDAPVNIFEATKFAARSRHLLPEKNLILWTL